MKIIEKLLDKTRPGWRERRKRRKSLWHIPKIMVMFLLIGLTAYLLFIGMWDIHVLIYPDHGGHLNDFWNEGISGSAFISSFLLAIPLMLPAIGIALLTTNLLFWLIPPARRAFNKEANGYEELKFTVANSKLITLLFKYLLPIGFGLSLVGALTLSSLK